MKTSNLSPLCWYPFSFVTHPSRDRPVRSGNKGEQAELGGWQSRPNSETSYDSNLLIRRSVIAEPNPDRDDSRNPTVPVLADKHHIMIMLIDIKKTDLDFDA